MKKKLLENQLCNVLLQEVSEILVPKGWRQMTAPKEWKVMQQRHCYSWYTFILPQSCLWSNRFCSFLKFYKHHPNLWTRDKRKTDVHIMGDYISLSTSSKKNNLPPAFKGNSLSPSNPFLKYLFWSELTSSWKKRFLFVSNWNSKCISTWKIWMVTIQNRYKFFKHILDRVQSSEICWMLLLFMLKLFFQP